MEANRLQLAPQPLRFAVPLLAAIAVMVVNSTVSVGGEARAEHEAAIDQVRQILAREASGELRDRRAALQDLPAESASADLVQWSMGNISWEKQWVPFESLVEDLDYQEKLREYRRIRDVEAKALGSQPLSLIHRRLANWCRAQKLKEQEWLHLTKVVESDPSDVSAHARLGDERIAGVWYSRGDVAVAKAKSLKVSQDLSVWLPRVKSLLVAHQSKEPARQATVARHIQELAHADAVPAIHVALLVADGALARQLVELLAEIGTPDAAIVLSQVALADPYGPLGDVAIQGLHDLPAEFYVPALLGALSSPITHALAIMEGSNGQLMLQQALFRETETQRSVQQLLRTIQFDVGWVNLDLSFNAFFQRVGPTGIDRTSSRMQNLSRDSRTRLLQPDRPLSYEEKLARRAAQTQLQNEARIQQDQVDAANSRTLDLNRRIYHVLSLTTDAQVQPDPHAWWQWWYARNELYVPQAEKPTQFAYQIQNQIVPVTTYSQSGPSISVSANFRSSCLVAGTLVQTAEGLRPVDHIQPGDLVLSQHPESGELTYKPVLQVTTRPPAPIVAIETDESIIRATGGHLFWVAGQGWARARTLTPEMVFHDVHGTTKIRSVTAEAEKETAYNLIVADFHTYFVGSERVLSYDNTPLRPTAVKVPGLATH